MPAICGNVSVANVSIPSLGTFQVGNVKTNTTVPELRIYTFFDNPVGPHPVAMFEVNLFTPAQFGAFVPWLVINRGPLSALIHPNTHDETEDERNHTQRATWLGDRIPLDLRIFKLMKEAEKRKEEEAEEKAKAGRL